MTLQEAFKTLGIEQYAERIIKSNSRGELFHLQQYIILADVFDEIGETDWFSDWFEKIVAAAEENWERPESVFQHIDKILLHQLDTPLI